VITERLYKAEGLLIKLIKRKDVSHEATQIAIDVAMELSAIMGLMGVKEEQIAELNRRLNDG
jgi:hypothetical protein